MDSASPPDTHPDTPLEVLRMALPSVRADAYLNAGTLGPMPEVAAHAMRERFERDVARRQAPGVWDDLFAAQGAARAEAARLTGATEAQVSLQHTTHDAINACLWGVDLQAGDEIVTTAEEHPGVLVPLRILRERRGVAFREVPWATDPGAFAADLAAACTPATRLVVISHVSWVSGAVADLAAVRSALPVGVRLVVDGAQGAGAMPVTAEDGWDAYTVSGQKWPCGPNGSGALVLRDPEAWHPTFGAFFTTTDPERCLEAPWQSDGRRFEHSQEDILPLVGFAAAVGFLLEQVGLERATSQSRALNVLARTQLAGVMERAIAAGASGELQGTEHLLTLPMPPGQAPDLATALADQGVVVRPLGPDLLRLSLAWWNTDADIERCASALADALDLA